MSAAVEPTQPTDEWVQTACRAFQTTVEDFDHLSPDWPDWRDGVTAALAAAYPVMVKQAIADFSAEVLAEINAEVDTGKWSGHWTNGLLHAVSVVEIARDDFARRARAGGGDQ